MENNLLNITISAEYSTDLANQIAADREEYEAATLKSNRRNLLWTRLKTIGRIIGGVVTVIVSLPQIISFLSGILEKL